MGLVLTILFLRVGTAQGMHSGYAAAQSSPGRSMQAGGSPSTGPVQQGQGIGAQGRYPSAGVPLQYRPSAPSGLPRQPMQAAGGPVGPYPSSQAASNPLAARSGLGGTGGVGSNLAAGPGRPSQGMERSVGAGHGPGLGASSGAIGARSVDGAGAPGMPQMLNLPGRSGPGASSGMSVHSGTGRAVPSGVASAEVFSMMAKGAVSGQMPGGASQIAGSPGSALGEKELPVFDTSEFPSLSGAFRRPVEMNGEAGQGFGSSGDLYGSMLSLQQRMGLDFSISRDEFPALPGSGPGAMSAASQQLLNEGGMSAASQAPQFPALGRSGSVPPGFGPPGQASGSSVTAGLEATQAAPPGMTGYTESIARAGFYSGMGESSETPPASEGYEHLMQQQEELRQSQANAVDMDNQASEPSQASGGTREGTADHYGLLGLLSVIRMHEPDLSTLALGTDLTTLGLNLNSSESLFKTFSGPWSDTPARPEPEFQLPACYTQQAPRLQLACFTKFQLETLFYIFYSMPGDEAQLFAADELSTRGWWFHKELKTWLSRVTNADPAMKTDRYERGSFWIFDTSSWERVRKDNFLVQYEQLERSPGLPRAGLPPSAPSGGNPT